MIGLDTNILVRYLTTETKMFIPNGCAINPNRISEVCAIKIRVSGSCPR
jgi:hypothetical protein